MEIFKCLPIHSAGLLQTILRSLYFKVIQYLLNHILIMTIPVIKIRNNKNRYKTVYNIADCFIFKGYPKTYPKQVFFDPPETIRIRVWSIETQKMEQKWDFDAVELKQR